MVGDGDKVTNYLCMLLGLESYQSNTHLAAISVDKYIKVLGTDSCCRGARLH